jgi:hypothetical protein
MVKTDLVLCETGIDAWKANERSVLQFISPIEELITTNIALRCFIGTV